MRHPDRQKAYYGVVTYRASTQADLHGCFQIRLECVFVRKNKRMYTQARAGTLRLRTSTHRKAPQHTVPRCRLELSSAN